MTDLPKLIQERLAFQKKAPFAFMPPGNDASGDYLVSAHEVEWINHAREGYPAVLRFALAAARVVEVARDAHFGIPNDTTLGAALDEYDRAAELLKEKQA